MVNGNAYLKIERDNALAVCTHNLHHAIAVLRIVRHFNQIHQFNVELPPEQQLIEAISHLAKIYHQPLETT